MTYILPFENIEKLDKKEIRISLAKPNKTVIGILNEAFSIRQHLKLGQLNKLDFNIPYTITQNNRTVKNKHVDIVLEQLLLKVEYLNKVEWYIIGDTKDSLNDTNIKQVEAYSLPFQLSNKYIREWAGVEIDGEYRKESLNANQILEDLLKETNWRVGYIDTLFITRYRTIDFSNTTALDAIFSLAEKFNAVITWDDKNKKINLIDPEKTGQFRGLRISDQNLLKSFEKEVRSGEMATRLKLYGQDNLSIREINPTGTDFIEDFSHFMKGFSMDDNENVLSSSMFMSDELCKAIIKYRNKVINKTPTFKSLLANKENTEDELTIKLNDMSNLENDLVQIQDRIILKQTMEQDVSSDRVLEDNKKNEISLKRNEINSLNNNLNSINQQILNLKNDLSLSANYTQEQIDEMSNFIIEKVWENTNITSPEELMELGEKEMGKLNKPNTVYNIGIVNLLKYVDKKSHNIKLGDKIRFKKKELKESVESQIIEIELDYDNKDIRLTIADSTLLNSDEDALTKLLYKSISSSSIVDMNKNKWDDVSSVGKQVENILNNAWDSAKQEIIGGVNQSVIIDRTGITTRDMDSPHKFIRIVGGVIGLTDDDGITFKTAITAKGIIGEKIVGRILIGQSLFMENEKGSFRFDQDGVTVDGNDFRITGGDNGVTINPNTGISVMKSDGKVETILNATDGIKVRVKKGTTWTDEFYYDPVNERLTVDGEIRARDLKINGQSVLLNDKLNGTYITNLNADTIVSGTIRAIDIVGSTITGGILTGAAIRTAPSGNRIEINTANSWNSIHCYDENNELHGLTVSNSGAISIFTNGEISGKIYGTNKYFEIESFKTMYMGSYGDILVESSRIIELLGETIHLSGSAVEISTSIEKAKLNGQYIATENWVDNIYAKTSEVAYMMGLFESDLNSLASRVSALESASSSND